MVSKLNRVVKISFLPQIFHLIAALAAHRGESVEATVVSLVLDSLTPALDKAKAEVEAKAKGATAD